MDKSHRTELAGSLIGKKVQQVHLTDSSLRLIFEDDTSVLAEAYAGPGNGEWDTRTIIRINNVDVVNE